MTRKTTRYARKRAAGHTPRRADSISVSRVYTTRLRPAELAQALDPCRQALQAFREARASYAQWVVLCTAGHVAEAIEDGGIYRGQRQIIDEANAALDAIGARQGREAATWRPGPCRGAELAALADLVAAHSRQLHELTYGEYTRAADLAVARVATGGGAVFRARDGLGGRDWSEVPA